MQSLLERISALEAEIEELKSGVQNKLSADKVTQATSVTEPGWAADARQMNPSAAGSLAGKVNSVQSMIGKTNFYKGFAKVPFPDNSYEFAIVYGDDDEVPLKGYGWWNVVTTGVSSRITQIAFCPFGDIRNRIFIRQNHDGTWFGWYVFAGSLAN